MQIWHDTPDTGDAPRRVRAGSWLHLVAGTAPVHPRQAVWLEVEVTRVDGIVDRQTQPLQWMNNVGTNSYWQTGWRCELGDNVAYRFRGETEGEPAVLTPWFLVRSGPALHVALIWHHHQPAYDAGASQRPVHLRMPWVRLHAVRDYAGMALIAREFPEIHLTINLTPVLLRQLEEYGDHGATDDHLDLTVARPEGLCGADRERLLQTFFAADWHGQILPHPRYAALFDRRRDGCGFSNQDLRDLQMWSNLAWFGEEFRTGEVELPDGAPASVQRFVERGEGFTHRDVLQMVAEQRRIIRAVIPLHRAMQDAGQVEVSTTPFGHPILPLLIDSDAGTIDLPGATHPPRFAHPEDADLHIERALTGYGEWFGRAPRGMWLAEGAISSSALCRLEGTGLQWVATDEGVLARSGRWGYDTTRPDVLCTPYRLANASPAAPTVLFRAHQLSDEIGFRFGQCTDASAAAASLVAHVHSEYASRVRPDDDSLLTIALDGENAWGGYERDGRPFLRALYRLLADDADLMTVTPAEYLHGNPARGVRAHPPETQPQVHELFTGSWIDESGSAAGVDLGTWIGEPEENSAWEMLGVARDRVDAAGGLQVLFPRALQALLSAEGSDWFWWLGADQDSGDDAAWDSLFRAHLQDIFRHQGWPLPPLFHQPIVPRRMRWSVVAPVPALECHERLTVEARCPAALTWWIDAQPSSVVSLVPVGGVMEGSGLRAATIGPFPRDASALHLSLRCMSSGCRGRCACDGSWMVKLQPAVNAGGHQE